MTSHPLIDEVARLVAFEAQVFYALHPDCPVHPGIPNPCPPGMCDCFAADNMVAQITNLKADADTIRVARAAIEGTYHAR